MIGLSSLVKATPEVILWIGRKDLGPVCCYNNYQRTIKTPVHTYRKEKGFAPVCHCLAVGLSSIMKAALERKKNNNKSLFLFHELTLIAASVWM